MLPFPNLRLSDGNRGPREKVWVKTDCRGVRGETRSGIGAVGRPGRPLMLWQLLHRASRHQTGWDEA
jgi:hypothetical protein